MYWNLPLPRTFKTESEFTRHFCQTLLVEGGGYKAIVGSGHFQVSGLPDRYLYCKEVPGCWVEFKKDFGKSNMLQILTMQEFVKFGIPAFVIRYNSKDNTVRSELPHKKASEHDESALVELHMNELTSIREFLLATVNMLRL